MISESPAASSWAETEPATEEELVLTVADLTRVVDELLALPKGSLVGFDFEATGLDHRRDHPLLLGIGKHALLVPRTGLEALRPVMESEDLYKAAYYATYDGGWFQQAGIYPRRVVCCLMGAMLPEVGLVHPQGYYRLGEVLKRKLGVFHDKGLQKSFIGVDPATFWPSSAQVAYLKRDVKYLPALARWELEEIRREGMAGIWSIENTFTQVIAMMQLHGAPLDLAGYREELAAATAEFEGVSRDLMERLTPHILNVRRRQHAAETAVHDEWKEKKDAAERAARLGLYGTPEKVSGTKEQLLAFNAALKDWKTINPEPTVHKLSTDPINPASDRQLKPALLELGLPVKNVQRETFLRLRPEHPEHAELLDALETFSDKSHFVSIYGEGMLGRVDEDSRLRSVYDQLKSTGRISSKKWHDKERDAWRGHALQNPDKRLKKYVRPGPGRRFAIADYSQIELRVMAEYILREFPDAEDALVRAFRDGEDPHSRMASTVSGIPYEEVLAHYKEDERLYDIRHGAKTTNFSTMFKISKESLAVRIYVDRKDTRPFTRAHVEEAGGYIDAFYHLNPHIRPIQEQWERMALEEQYTVTLGGRRRYYPRLTWGAVKYSAINALKREASNHPVQGTAADIAKLAGVKVYLWLAESCGIFETFLWNAVHDELCLECPEELAEEVAEELGRLCTEAYETYITHVPGDVTYGVFSEWSH